ncbi:hypothetical protein MKX03_021409 [Papaver bracteatum]|nr:hypothetical protein MKX03_021409 [Papaver bracteatum]
MDSGYHSSSSSSEIEKDRISNLPDSLLHHILSFMDIKYAVQSCVLSRRWRYIWISLPFLRFSDTIHYYDKEDSTDEELEQATRRYVNFVNQVLDHRDNTDILRFHLKFSSLRPTISEISRWVDTAVSRNVQELVLKSYVQGLLYNFKTVPEDGIEIPPCLFTCQSFTKMELQLCGLEHYDDYKIILPNEMKMSFNDEKLTNRFFSSFPSLETLILEMGSYGIHHMNLHISFPKLKYFKFDSQNYESNCEVKLHAPSLSSFIFDSHMSTSFTVENFSYLATADINTNEVEMPGNSDIHAERKGIYARHTMGLLRGIQKVKVLMLGDSVLMALGGAPDILDTQLPEFYNLQDLEFHTNLTRDCMCSIFNVLKNSPNIESVSLGYRFNPPLYPYCNEVKFYPENIGDYWDAGLSVSCTICYLKFVEIKGICGCVNELKFLEIGLKHASGLEKLVLTTSNYSKQDSQRKKRMIKFSKMLLKFPTASKKILILLNSRVSSACETDFIYLFLCILI